MVPNQWPVLSDTGSALCLWSATHTKGPFTPIGDEGHTQWQLEAGIEVDGVVRPRVSYLHKADRFSRNLQPLQQRSQRHPSGVRRGGGGSCLRFHFGRDTGGGGGGGSVPTVLKMYA